MKFRLLLSALCLLALFVVSGCSTLASLSDPPADMVTAEALHLVLKEKPEWAGPAQEIAQAVMDRASATPTLDELEKLAREEIDRRYASEEIRKAGYGYVTRVRKGLETDLAAMGALTLADRAIQLATFVSWLAGA